MASCAQLTHETVRSSPWKAQGRAELEADRWTPAPDLAAGGISAGGVQGEQGNFEFTALFWGDTPSEDGLEVGDSSLLGLEHGDLSGE